MTVDQKITFRHMRKDDLDSVMVIDRLSFSLPWPKNAYLNDLNNNEKALLKVAEASTNRNDARVVGMIDLWLILDEAHLATLAVHPDYRGLGIATRLIDLVLLEAHELGAIKVMLEVRSSNYAAQALYKQFGFKVVHRRPRYYVDNREDALLMNLDDLDLWVKSSLQTELQKTTS
jgi:ribosomal-protein-alanine N-acetyltransferase